MKIACPSCSNSVPAADISLETGWAKCGACQEVFPLDAVVPGFAGERGESAHRPFDARVRVERSEHDLLVSVPALGLGYSTWWYLGFAAFWLAFIAFWTWGALGGLSDTPGAVNWVFASFSIPFWIVGFSLLAWSVWHAWGTSTVRIDPEWMVTQRRCLEWSRSRSVDLRRVQHARPATAAWYWAANNYPQQSRGVEIVYEGRFFALPASGEEEERWLLGEINGFLERQSRR